jgi:hypothetical protein
MVGAANIITTIEVARLEQLTINTGEQAWDVGRSFDLDLRAPSSDDDLS